MLEKRKRISKREIKQDTLVTTYYKAYNFFMENQLRIFIGVAAVALVVVAVVLYSSNKAKNNVTAAGLLSKVMPTYDAGQYKQAIDGQSTSNTVGLKEIVEKYGGTDAGETARIMLANSYYNIGDYEAAFKNYDDYSGSIPLYKSTALAGKALYYEWKKDFAKAADLYQEASKISEADPSNAEYLMKAGIDLMKIGKNEEAKAVFETVKQDYKTSTASQEVDKYLVQVQG